MESHGASHAPYAGGLSAPASKGKATSRGSFAAGGAEPEAVEISICHVDRMPTDVVCSRVWCQDFSNLFVD